MSRATAMAIAALVLLTAAALAFGGNPHPHVWWEAIPGYAAVFGYGGAWGLALIAKSVLAPLLHRTDEEPDT